MTTASESDRLDLRRARNFDVQRPRSAVETMTRGEGRGARSLWRVCGKR